MVEQGEKVSLASPMCLLCSFSCAHLTDRMRNLHDPCYQQDKDGLYGTAHTRGGVITLYSYTRLNPRSTVPMSI